MDLYNFCILGIIHAMYLHLYAPLVPDMNSLIPVT